ncbi:AzlD domain-containing protein [Litorivicinus lipolyticus]|uniref:AzlD domain-containing protein n=1 Tax=Litorivicinus lipolyticus TaxID=418701 RepID=A0A5Q2QBY5_9GAMM|nr:AzlD domain-containing protein [Litorivicinus lipolyticus]QGG79526.1 AzlD domain-containing protein [Litorivicinus lipolyticus]
MIESSTFWLVTLTLGLGTFLIRFSFLGFWGARPIPDWARLHLKYVGTAVFPALVVPLVVWPPATDGVFDPVRFVAALAALLAGLRFGVVWAIVLGMGTLYTLQYVLN